MKNSLVFLSLLLLPLTLLSMEKEKPINPFPAIFCDQLPLICTEGINVSQVKQFFAAIRSQNLDNFELLLNKDPKLADSKEFGISTFVAVKNVKNETIRQIMHDMLTNQIDKVNQVNEFFRAIRQEKVRDFLRLLQVNKQLAAAQQNNVTALQAVNEVKDETIKKYMEILLQYTAKNL